MGNASSNHSVPFHLGLAAILVITLFTFGPSGDASAAERVTTFDTFATEEPYVALTFDVTFDRGGGAQILDTLAAYGVQATFAVNLGPAESGPDAADRQ